MTALTEHAVPTLVAPASFAAEMDTDLDEPVHGDLVSLTLDAVRAGDYVLVANESAGDRWFQVAEVGYRWVRPVGLAPIEGEQVWAWTKADMEAHWLRVTSGGSAA